MNYFGNPWNDFLKEYGNQQAVPVGEACLWCNEEILENDRGIFLSSEDGDKPNHVECFLRQIVGSVAHQKGLCSCCGAKEEKFSDMTPRQEAILACVHYEKAKNV